MRRALIGISAAAAALLACMWLAFEPANELEATRPAATPIEKLDVASARQPDDAAPKRPESGPTELSQRIATLDEQRSEVEARFSVRVVDAAGRANGSVGAQVWIFARRSPDAMYDPALGLDFGALGQLLARADDTRACDAEGIASFRSRAGFVVALARSTDGRMGWNVGEGDDNEPLEIELVRDFDVDVLVRESDGRPAVGAPVVLRRVLTVSSDYVEARTDSEGRARLRHAGVLISRPSGAWYAQVGLAATDVPAQRVPLQRPPNAPLEFTLPPRGSVELVLGERDGRVRAMLRSTATSRPRRSFERWPTGSSTPLTAAVDGRALFEHVALGEQFEATVVYPLFERTVKFAGPTRPGERVVVRLDESSSTDWSARVVNEVGAPWRTELVVRAEEGSRVLGQRQTLTLEPDAEGFVRVQCPQLPPQDDARVLTFVALDAQGRDTFAGRARVVGLQQVEDLGVVVLRALQPLASGRVLDWRGQPVAGARVLLVDTSTAGEPTPRLPFEARSDESGQFELQFALEEANVALQAFAAGHASEVRRVPSGARDVLLELVWGGTVSLEIANVVHGRESAVNLRVALTPSGASVDDERARELPARRKGSVVLEDVPAGAWDFVVAAELIGVDLRELARVRSVARIDQLEPSADAGRFDLRALIEPIVISASAAGSGERFFGFGLSARRTDPSSPPAWSFTRATESLLMPAALAPFDLRVNCPGFLETRVEAVRSDLHVVLRPAPWIEVVLAGDAPPLPDGQSYCVALSPLTGAPATSAYRTLDSSGVCRLQAKAAGTLRIAVGICAIGRAPIGGVRELARESWPQVEVFESGDQRVSLSPTAAARDSALAQPATRTRVELPHGQ